MNFIQITYFILGILSGLCIIGYIKKSKENKSLKDDIRKYSVDIIELREKINNCREDYYRNQLNIANEKIKDLEGLSQKHKYTICFENEYENDEGDYIFEKIEANYPVVSEDGSIVYFKLYGRVVALFNNVKYWKEENDNKL